MSKTETYDLDFAREAAINLTKKRAIQELERCIQTMKRANALDAVHGLEVAIVMIQHLSNEMIEEVA